ncbi:MAG TPA: hypothetical protein VFC10_18650 [Terriglobia bacterium]|nr:hypothetical protein [Terriglobia bacterium]
MKKRVMMLPMICCLYSCLLLAGQQAQPESAVLKARHQQEVEAFKLKKRYAKSALENSMVPKAVRIQMKHELQMEQRKLRERQKDERQTLKDRERLLKLERKELESE